MKTNNYEKMSAKINEENHHKKTREKYKR